jgi:putative ABC transport system ATP-binding protein
VTNSADSPVLRLDGVEKDYGEGEARFTVLKDLQLRVEPGDYVAVIGASGSGKSTLLNILGCLDRPTRGTYELDGTDVSQLNDDELSRVRNRSIGFIFQSFQLINELTVLENVEIPLFYGSTPRRTRRARCLELLDALGLNHRLRYHPNKLSGGERQRVAVARALVNEPALLLADEPTGNLDTATGAEVLALFDELHEQGRTIVTVTHNNELAQRIPHVVELLDGRIVREELVEPAAGN